MKTTSQRTYIPAAGRDIFLPFYDLITSLMGADRARAALIEQTRFSPGQRVLDIGCGTGSLAILLKQRHPQIEIIGLDPDPKALARARRKARRSAVSLRFDQGFSDFLEFPDGFFDHVFSSYMFHHLDTDTKEKTLREIRRVLKAGRLSAPTGFRRPGYREWQLAIALDPRAAPPERELRGANPHSPGRDRVSTR